MDTGRPFLYFTTVLIPLVLLEQFRITQNGFSPFRPEKQVTESPLKNIKKRKQCRGVDV
jgi:hypothetical protein